MANKKTKNKFPGYPHYPANEDIMNSKDNERVDLDMENQRESGQVGPELSGKQVEVYDAEGNLAGHVDESEVDQLPEGYRIK